jgi:hypothetical protein
VVVLLEMTLEQFVDSKVDLCFVDLFLEVDELVDNIFQLSEESVVALVMKGKDPNRKNVVNDLWSHREANDDELSNQPQVRQKKSADRKKC